MHQIIYNLLAFLLDYAQEIKRINFADSYCIS